MTIPKRMSFQKSSKGGEGGHFKNLCCRFWTFKHGFLSTKHLPYHFPKMSEGGGSKSVWNFSENSSVLEASPVPKLCCYTGLPNSMGWKVRENGQSQPGERMGKRRGQN